MAKLKSDCSIKKVILHEENGTRHYSSYLEERWNELKEELNNFGISFSSLYDIEFSDDQYKLSGRDQPLGARDVYVYYGDTCIAKTYILGSNVCDRDAYLEIYLSKLKSIYIK